MRADDGGNCFVGEDIEEIVTDLLSARPVALVGDVADRGAGDSPMVARERLFARLDRALSLGSVYLSGGAGTGKSALVTTYLAARGLHHLQFRLDAEDADPFFLLERLHSPYPVAIRSGRALAGTERPRARLSDAAIPDPFVAGRQAFRRLFETCDEPCILVLDDLERLPIGCPTVRILADALSAMPDGWSMVLVGRCDTPAPFARARASATLDTIEETELRLTADETVAVARSRANRPLADDELDWIVAVSGGWAALVVLLANAPRVRAADAGVGDVPDVVFDYFAEEVLATLEPSLQQELERLSLSPLLTETLAARVVDASGSPARLDDLAARHFFIERFERSHAVSGAQTLHYRLHELFRMCLARRLAHRLGADATRAEAIRVARLLESAGEHENALALLLEHRAFDEAVPAMERLAPQMIHRQRHMTVLGWMLKLPPERIHASGSLSLWCGAAKMFIDPPAARELLERAWQECEGRDSPEAVLSCCIAIDTWLLHWDDFHGMDIWMARLAGRLADSAPPQDPDLAAHVACAMLNGTLFRGSDPHELAHWHERGLALLDHRIEPSVYMMLAQALVLVPLWTRSVALSELVLERVSATVFSDEQIEPLVELWYRTLEAPLRWNQADRDGAEYACARGLTCARESGAGFSDVLLPYHAGIACLIAGDEEAAAGYAERVAAAIGTRAERLMDITCHHQLAGMLARHRGRHALAAEHLEKAADRATSAGLGFAAAMQHVGLAYVAADQGDEVLARRWLAAAIVDVGDLHLSMIELDVQLCEAWLARQRGESALDELRRAFATARRDARVASSWWSRQMLAELCAVALDAAIERKHVCRIVRTHTLSAPPSFRHLATWPWKVRLHLLGQVRTVVDGEPLAADGARSAKPLELVQVLAALGGQAQASRLADLLWPDADGDAAMDSFKTTLSRARRQLGVDGALPLVDGQLSLDPDLVWCDAVALVQLDQQTAPTGTDDRARCRADDAIITLYGGDLLPDESRRWAIDPRRRVRERWLRAVLRRGAAHEQADEHAIAARHFEAALECSSAIALLYRRGMTAHLRAGTPDAGLLLYRRCCTEMTGSPDAATGSVHSSLLRAIGSV